MTRSCLCTSLLSKKFTFRAGFNQLTCILQLTSQSRSVLTSSISYLYSSLERIKLISTKAKLQ